MPPLLASAALGLVAAWPVGTLGLGLGRLVERLTGDPRPRAAAWSLAFALPGGALAATLALTFAPGTSIAPTDAAAAETGAAWTPPPAAIEGLAWGLVGLSAVGLLARTWRWNLGRRRLAAVRATAAPCRDPVLIEAVLARAARLGIETPPVRISDRIAEPLLAGAWRPVILLPRALTEASAPDRLALVCGHELAHLRRGDNWRIPVEEALAGLFWLSLPVAVLRSRMLAAREAVCDRAALDGAGPEARRDYARALVEALRLNARPAAQSAFTGRERALVRLRLSAILQPRGEVSLARLGLVVALGGALTAATGAGSLALADQARRLAPPAAAETPPEAALAPDAAPAPEAAATPAPAAKPAPMAVRPAEPTPAATVAAAEPAPVPDSQSQVAPTPSVVVQVETQPKIRLTIPANAGEDLARRVQIFDPGAKPSAEPKVAVEVRMTGDESPWPERRGDVRVGGPR